MFDFGQELFLKLNGALTHTKKIKTKTKKKHLNTFFFILKYFKVNSPVTFTLTLPGQVIGYNNREGPSFFVCFCRFKSNLKVKLLCLQMTPRDKRK